jgi:PIN domain nuclease of toxin-antitoxin system
VSDFVLDSSAVLALLWNEPGANVVATALPLAVISAVNVAEVVTKLTEVGSTTELFDRTLNRAQVEIAPFTESQARLCGELRRATKSRGLSLGDRACLALAIERGLTAVTADAAWVGATDAPVNLIRPAKA